MNEPQLTPGTLTFPVGPFQVLVRPSFWLVMAIFGGLGMSGTKFLVTFVVVAFASVLFHELGHAVTGRIFGTSSWIELYSFGGLTHHDRALSRWRDVLMAAAGPGFGFALGLACWLVLPHVPVRSVLKLALQQAVWINSYWGVMNCLPVLPLDGGRVMSGVLGPGRRRIARIFAIAVAALVVVYGVLTENRWIAIMFGLLAFQNFQALSMERDLRPIPPPEPEKDALGRGWKALLSGQEQEASRLAHLALSAAQTQDEQNAARDLLAWVALADQDPRAALTHLEKVAPPEQARRLTAALALEGLQLYDRALPHAEAAYQVEPSETSATLAIRLLDRAGRYADAERIASSFGWRSQALRDARLGDVAFARGDHARAAELYGDAFESGRRPVDAYNAACAAARAGDVPRAADWLGRALDAGFDDVEQIESDPDLADARQAPQVRSRLKPRSAGSGPSA
ncbi:MAG TPA: site-2 protease family protein [Myxococcales bacterium]|nr:site-2 protease family protein [Myxococcales bacterium]